MSEGLEKAGIETRSHHLACVSPCEFGWAAREHVHGAYLILKGLGVGNEDGFLAVIDLSQKLEILIMRALAPASRVSPWPHKG